mgnify:CR=1 FL=1
MRSLIAISTFAIALTACTTTGAQPANTVADGRTVTLAAIINQYTPDLGYRLSGLQAANAATVIQDGPIDKEFGAGAYTLDLADGVHHYLSLDHSLELRGRIAPGADASPFDNSTRPGSTFNACAAAARSFAAALRDDIATAEQTAVEKRLA